MQFDSPEHQKVQTGDAQWWSFGSILSDQTTAAVQRELVRVSHQGSELLPHTELKNDLAEQEALQEVTSELAHKIFADATKAKTGDGITSAAFAKVRDGNYYLNATADFENLEKGKPKPIELGSDPVTIVPSMSKGAFHMIVLEPQLRKALADNNEGEGKPINIKLRIGDEDLTATMKLRLTREPVATADH